MFYLITSNFNKPILAINTFYLIPGKRMKIKTTVTSLNQKTKIKAQKDSRQPNAKSQHLRKEEKTTFCNYISSLRLNREIPDSVTVKIYTYLRVFFFKQWQESTGKFYKWCHFIFAHWRFRDLSDLSDKVPRVFVTC